MNRFQWLAIGVAVLLVFIIYIVSQEKFFGEPKPTTASAVTQGGEPALTIDSILSREKKGLTQQQLARINQLETRVSKENDPSEKIHVLHELANFWADTASEFAPYAWYTAEAARLENSEKSLTFAARLFLTGLKQESDHALKKWEALQAKDLFERSLKMNPEKDSLKVYLGEVYVYGDIAMPMQGVSMIREVADRDTANIHAQFTLAEASLASGQTDKAIDRFQRIARIDPSNLRALLMLGELYEKSGNKQAAIAWYEKSLPYAGQVNGLKQEIEGRIIQLKN